MTTINIKTKKSPITLLMVEDVVILTTTKNTGKHERYYKTVPVHSTIHGIEQQYSTDKLINEMGGTVRKNTAVNPEWLLQQLSNLYPKTHFILENKKIVLKDQKKPITKYLK